MIDKKQARKDLEALYNSHSLCYNDQYYVNSLILKYGMSLTELEKIVGRPRIVSKWEWD